MRNEAKVYEEQYKNIYNMVKLVATPFDITHRRLKITIHLFTFKLVALRYYY